MAQAKKSNKKDDERRARARFIDQKGQWVNTTPASVKKKQDKDMEKLIKMMEGNKKTVARKKKK